MAVTHADLAPRPRATDLGSKTGVFIIVFSILLGLSCFILCLIAEATRSEATWMATSQEGKGKGYECTYSGSGKMPLLCAAGAFLGLAVAMVTAHVYMMVAVSQSPPPALVTWDPVSAPARTLTWQAGFFFVTTWFCFAVGEILLLVGLSIESGHLKDWASPRPSCLIIRQGMFAAAGVFGLITVFLAAGLYTTALRAQRLLQEQENVQQEMLEAAVLHASPPRSPARGIRAVANENPVAGESLNEQPLSLYLSVFSKQPSWV
ncbi:uncharacterized protein LOC127800511 [Diospyros lotus]|uniref:uncharacterized protein LOC127800511 n=1 Tax=Diospyros lotus TaxID=55363 RepID=UPI00224CF9DB|nr:uncharacterized protein LOC127800511 [Diospyros lotus]